MPRLIYIVDVDSGDLESDFEYLQNLQSIFRGITENIVSFGFTEDETSSSSTIGDTEKLLVNTQQNQRHDNSGSFTTK